MEAARTSKIFFQTSSPAAPVTPAAFWALLPPAERERLGLQLSRLVLKAVRPPMPTPEEDG